MPRSWISVAIVLISLWIVANIAFATFVEPGPEPVVPNDDLTADFS